MSNQHEGDPSWLSGLNRSFDLAPLEEIVKQLLPSHQPRQLRGLELLDQARQGPSGLSHAELQELCDLAGLDDRSRESLGVRWWFDQLRRSKPGRHFLGFMIDMLADLAPEQRQGEEQRLLRRWLDDQTLA